MHKSKLVATTSCLAGMVLTGVSAAPVLASAQTPASAQTLAFGPNVNAILAAGDLVAPTTLPMPGTTGSISIVKQLPGDPAPQYTEFSVQQVLSFHGKGVDLTSLAGWEVLEEIGVFAPDAASAADPDQAYLPLSKIFVAMTSGNATLAAARTATTDPVTARAEFADLPVGLYLVQETGATTLKAAPFLVMLPYPNPLAATTSEQWQLNPVPTPKVVLPGEERVYDAALKIWSQRVYEPITDGGWREVWNFDTALDSVGVIRDADGAPMGPKAPTEVQIGDAVQYELQVHNQGNQTLHIDEITFHSAPGLVLITQDEIHPGQQNHVWVPMPEHDNQSHLYVVPEEHIVLNPGEYHQFAFTAVVTPEISLDGRFDHWDSDPELFDIWAEVSGISGLEPPLELRRQVGMALSRALPFAAVADVFADADFGWVPVEDYDSNHHYNNWFNAASYVDNEIWEDQRNFDGDKDNHDGDHTKLVERRKPTVIVDTSTNPGPNASGPGASGTAESAAASAEAVAAARAARSARRAQLYRTGVQVFGLVAGASLLVAGVAMMRRRAAEKA